MAFSILNRRLLENNSIKKIVNRLREFTVFNNVQQEALGIDTSIIKEIILRDYDGSSNRGFYYQNGRIVSAFNQHNFVLPIIRFDEIKEESQIISEDDDTLTIRYGRHIVLSVTTDDERRKIKVANMMGNLVETDKEVTFLLENDGTKVKLRVFKDAETGKEFVFLSRQAQEKGVLLSSRRDTIDDNVNADATYIGIVGDLTWTVDKETGIAICNTTPFLSEKSQCEYDKSALKTFLESDEFSEELGVKAQIKKKKEVSKSPFGDKKEKLNLEQKIRRVLVGGKRIPYLVGHPGIGKTQIAKSINKNCLAFNLATFLPDTFSGKTGIVPGDKTIIKDGDKTIEHSEPGKTATTEPEWHVQLVEMSNRCRQNNERCVLLLDEFDKLTPNMQVFINGIVDDPRTIAGWIIPDNVDIILAGNSEEYSDASFKISGEVASRLTKMEVKVDYIDWLKWASKHDIDPIVKAYLAVFPKKIIVDVKDENDEYDYAKSLTPRSWDQKISEELKGARKSVVQPYLEPYMDEKERKDFEDFMNLYLELNVEEILKGNIPKDIFDLTYDKIQIIISCLFATARTEDEIYNSLLFIDYYKLNEYRVLFEKMWITINSSDDDILKFKLAESRMDERRFSRYGK